MRYARRLARILLVVAACAASSLASAQQRPLVTEDPEPIGDGRVLVEAGVETGVDVFYPVSGLRGDQMSVPVGLSFGFGSIAELQIDSGYQRLSIQSRESAPLGSRVPPDLTRTSDVIDAVVATKVRVVSEGQRRPAIGIRFATRLPNASNESGLGTDTTNFFAALLVGKTTGSLRIVGNAGIGILTSPRVGSVQEDALVASLSVARAFTEGFEIVGELAAQRVLFADEPPVGAEPRGALRAAARYTRGRWRVDGGLVVGVTRQDPDIGFTAGLTLVGNVFRGP